MCKEKHKFVDEFIYVMTHLFKEYHSQNAKFVLAWVSSLALYTLLKKAKRNERKKQMLAQEYLFHGTHLHAFVKSLNKLAENCLFGFVV